MSSPANTSVPPPEPTLLELQAMRQALTKRQLDLETAGCPYDSALSEAENAKRQYDYQEELKKLIHDQLQILAKLRKTASGPAKAGGKRAKKAPLDLSSMDDLIFS